MPVADCLRQSIVEQSETVLRGRKERKEVLEER